MENNREEIAHTVKIRILENDLEHLKDDVNDINKTLYNDGKGIVYDVKQLKTMAESGAGRTAAYINAVSVFISFIVMILMILEKMK